MRIIERSAVNVNQWNALVRQAGGSFFSYSWYLDAVAENWCLLIDDDYSRGMALPYTKRMGVEILYVPIFSRTMEAMGELSDDAINLIKKRFKVIELATRNNIFSTNETRVHQVIIDYDNRKLSSQAKRSLKKALNSGVQTTGNESYSFVFNAIEEELQGKFKGVDAERMTRLNRLFQSAEQVGSLKVFEVSDGDQTGGIVCLEDETKLLYLKGACPEKLKKSGGMYFALNSAIEYAKERNLSFDFGGSNVDGVRRFNKNLGGVDQTYYYYESNEAPFWFQWARKIKNQGIR
ncbi:MAG: hypothetical protein ACFHU9_17955 [Fluviicola sp.]